MKIPTPFETFKPFLDAYGDNILLPLFMWLCLAVMLVALIFAGIGFYQIGRLNREARRESEAQYRKYMKSIGLDP